MTLHEEEEEEDSKLASNRSDLEELDQDTGMWERARALSKSWASGESEKKLKHKKWPLFWSIEGFSSKQLKKLFLCQDFFSKNQTNPSFEVKKMVV